MSGVRHPGAPAGVEVLESRRRVAAYLRGESGPYLGADTTPGYVLVFATDSRSQVLVYALPTRKVRSALRVLENEVGGEPGTRFSRLLALAPPVDKAKLARQLARVGMRMAAVDSSGEPEPVLSDEDYESIVLAVNTITIDES